jgi:hypothetical protein
MFKIVKKKDLKNAKVVLMGFSIRLVLRFSLFVQLIFLFPDVSDNDLCQSVLQQPRVHLRWLLPVADSKKKHFASSLHAAVK